MKVLIFRSMVFGLSADIVTGFRFNQRWRSERVGNEIQITLSFDFPTHGYGHSVDFDTGSEHFKSELCGGTVV